MKLLTVMGDKMKICHMQLYMQYTHEIAHDTST